MKPITITLLFIENFKNIKALKLQPSETGLTVIGGDNEQGKTSVLDAIAWDLGGGKYAPSTPQREGAISSPYINITLSNGVTVERKGEKGALYIKDPSGTRSGQSLLDAFLSPWALNIKKFIDASDAEKTQMLLDVLGIGEELNVLRKSEKALYEERRVVGQIADQQTKYAAGLPEYPNTPEDLVSIAKLLEDHKSILLRNSENDRLRKDKEALKWRVEGIAVELVQLENQVNAKKKELRELKEKLDIANKTVQELKDEATTAIEENIKSLEVTNQHVAANKAKSLAKDEANNKQAEYHRLSTMITEIRSRTIALLSGAQLPLPELGIDDDCQLTYCGKKWDCMSSSQQLKTATAIAKIQNPRCGFVLVDGVEQMDSKTLNEFGEWAKKEELQILATRVSRGDECTIIIENGLPLGQTYTDVVNGEIQPIFWKEGSAF